MKRLSTFLAALLFIATAIFADGPFRNHRYDSFKALQVTSENILFIGNSITDMHCWPEAFVTSNGDYLPIVNRGNSGTYSTEQSDNLESYINGKPKKVFMMIGTNDIATSGGLNASPEQVLAYIKSIVTRIHAHSPNTKVYLYSILNNNTSNRVKATWLKTNEIVKAYADATDKVTYVDLYDKLTNVANGGAWSYDNLHLTAGAYQAWCETICQYLQEGENYTVSCVYPTNTLEVQNRGGLNNAAHGMRATYFSCLPIKSNDVLVFGDSFIKNGEWQEFLGNRNVKNRGTGWNNSGEIAVTSGIVDATFATIQGVEKVAPKAMFLYTGTADACGSTAIETVKSNYKALVDKLTQKAPNAKIYLMAICPRSNASHNERIAALNAYMQEITTGNIRFIDTYTPFLNGNVANTTFITGDYLYGLGYAKMANLMKEALVKDFPSDTYNVTSEEEAAVRYAQAGLRNQLTQVIARGLVATRGDEAGQYNATAMAAFDSKLAEATTLLEKSSITQDEVTAMANSLTTILNDALSMPKASTANETVWYQLSTPGRDNKYLTSNGAGAGVTGAAVNNYATSMWKFVARGNGEGLDIINRHDGSYLAPTAAYNNQITTSATQPAAGWTLSYCNTPGRFIISSGKVQLNQTGSGQNYKVYNWSNGETGTDRADAGCQYMVSIVTGEPDELPDPSLMTLTLTPTEFQKAAGKSTWTYHGNTTSGGWYGKFVTGTTPALTAESTDANANNIGWSNNQPWLQPGYTYNLTLPEGYVIGGYELTTKSVLGFTGTYTYTTATGTATSEAQSSEEKTVIANGLNTQAITLTVGDAVSTSNGLLITNLVIRYKEVLAEGHYSLEIKESAGSFTTGSKVWSMATNTSNPVALTFTSNANNMNVDGGYLQIHPGTAGTATYTIAVPAPYVITGYSFDYAFGSTGTGNKTITVGNQQYAVAEEKKTLSVTDLNTQSTGFTLSGSNQPVKLTNFIVNVVNSEIVGGEEEEEPELPAEITYTLDKTNGDLYRDGSINNNGWTSAWKSKTEPQIAFGTGKNNMQWSGSNIELMTGGGACTYTLTAPTGYMIEEYSFTFANNNHEVAHSLTMDNGMIYSTSKTPQTISNKNVQAPTVSFVLNGENGKGVVLTNFTVKVVRDVAVAPKVSTAENVYWYYITSASIQTYCAGKVIYYDSSTQKLRFDDKAFMADRIWSFWEQDGKLAIKNYKGEYFGTAPSGTGGSTAFGVVSEPNYIYNVNEAHGFFVIKDDKVELHAQNDNKVIVRWSSAEGNASLWRFNAVDVTNADAAVGSTYVQQGKVTTGIGNVDQPILRSTIRISGLEGSVDFQGVKGRFEGTDAADVTNVKAFFASNDRELFIDAAKKMTWREENGEQYGATVELAQDGTFTITGNKTMVPGDYYLWITYDIAETAKEGNLVDAVITGYTVDGKEVAENNGNPRHSVTVFLSEGPVLMPMDKGSLYYRIPAITAVTKNGKTRLVVLTDDRKQSQGDLPNHCYVVAQYSDDLGKTWSDPLTVAGTAETGGDYGHGDASIVTDRNTGNIIGIMTSCAEYGHGFFAGTAEQPPLWKTIISKDGGETWSVPQDHTASLFGAACDNEQTKAWKSGFSGSGAALQKRDGTLVSSFVNRAADNSQNFHFFMSKDGGKNWYVSGTSGTTAADEPKTLERNNGDLAISVRAGGYNYYNYTSDNGQTWYNAPQTRFNSGISGNACDGEYMVWCSTVEGNPWNIAFQTIPNSGSRENVSIALSTDEGATFGTPKTICPSGSAYSATVVLPDGTLGVYYEENGVSGSPFVMRFVRFSLDWASNGQYKFTEENPFKPIQSVDPAAVATSISEHGIGTFYANDPVNIPEGVKAYAAVEQPDMTEGVLELTEVEGIIPAHTGVVLRAAEGEYSLTQASTNGTVVNGNMLVGYAGKDESKEVSLAEGYTTYVLAVENDNAGFYKKEAAFTVNKHSAYLQVPAGETSADVLSINFPSDDTTEIKMTTDNGQQATDFYDLQGRRVENPTKGIYIVNGKKVVIK